MKKLKRMLLIHWHNYTKEVIEFDTINFLTGKTAAGKSTIIDALQLVMLGDTTGTFFNKAANEKSSRTLKSYLFGEKGDDGDVGFNYLRKERFSSYVVLEFEDTQNSRHFSAGIVCDCYKDQSFDYKWFIIHNHGIPENLFIDENTKIPYDIRGLRTFLTQGVKGKKGVEFEFSDTNKRYQEVTLAKFGQVKNKYRVLLKKAVPFSPISDIEQFITESVCDIKNKIDIEQMQSDIRQYKNLEQDAMNVQERIEKLKEISSLNADYENEKEKFRQQDYIFIRAGRAEAEQQEKAFKNQIEEKENLMQQHCIEMEGLEKELVSLKKEYEDLENKYHTSDVTKRERELSSKMDILKLEKEQLEQKIQSAVDRTRAYGAAWLRILEELKECGFSQEAAEEGLLFFENMKALDLEKAKKYPFLESAHQFAVLKAKANEFQVELKNQTERLKNNIEELERKIADLKKGIKPYPTEVTTLKNVLEENLYRLHQRTVPVSILADLLEIPNARWRNAIEGYLDKQKFYLLVPEEFYRDSLRIYNREKQEKKLHDAGLIDIGKLRKSFNKPQKPGSLMEEIEAETEDAKLYAEYLLGGVMKCEHVDDLRNHKIAITDEGMLYKGYVSRRINPIRYANPFIGRKSLEVLLGQMTEELEQQRGLYEQTINYHRIAKMAVSAGTLENYEAEQYEKAIKEGVRIPELDEQLLIVRREYDSLDFLFLDRMKKQMETYKDSITEKDNNWHTLDKKNERLSVELDILKKEKLPDIIEKITQIQREIKERFDDTWILNTGEPRFLHESKTRTMEALRTGFYSAKQQTEIKKNKVRKERTEKRSKYNGEYKMPFDIEKEDNQEFDKELDNLSDIQLPDYIEKIKDSKVKAYNQFRDDFIAKLKSNIETVAEQINELNASLKQSVFGTDTYQFEKKPNPEYRHFYDMIMDPLLMDTGGWNIASQSFNEKYQNEISELFRLLILNDTNVSAERRAEYERNIKKFTDYKTYLVFDLVVKNDQGEEQRLSKTLLKKSGGETQIPFYIALLASFSQVCRIRNKNQNNTIRLIILDEAFSKMDGERIQESIRLLRRFGLQAVFSAPPDKIPDIAPLVERNIAVYKDNRHSFTRYFDPKQIDESLVED